ncbi:MAG: TIGR02099 family protein [Proteobacteria bacterium]|nr:TIGR02099 family protein [Pseudomonadota bacterium]
MATLIRLVFTLLSWTIILFALATIGLRIGLANIDSYKNEIESWIAKDVIPGTSFVELRGGWDQFNPVLHLTRVSITTPDKSQALAIDEIVVEFDYFRSLWYRTPVVSEVTGMLAKLSVRKDLTQKWWLNDIPLSFASSDQTVSSFEELMAQMPHFIQIELDQLEIDDQASGQKYRINQVRIDMQQREDSIHWQLSAILPEALGNRLNIKSIIKHDNSVLYLKSNSLELTRIAELLDIKVGNLLSAELSGELWINLLDNRTPVLNGKVSIARGLWQTSPDNKPLEFALDVRINASRVDKQWKLGTYFENLSVNSQTLQGFNLQLRLTANGNRTLVQGWVEEFELNNVVLLREPFLSPETAAMIEQSQMRGRLNNIWFSVDPADIGSIELSANIANFSSSPVNAIPGIKGLNADFTLGRRNAALHLTGDKMSLDFEDRFKAPIEFDQLQLQANISLVDKGLVISVPKFEGVNTDIRLSGRMQLETDQASAPFLYLRAQFKDGRGSSHGRYLPLKILNKKVVAWLNRGIRKVDISAGELLFHGRVDGINYFGAKNTGEMVVDFDIDNAEILFHPDWAPARQASGRVMFHNSSMTIDIERVKFGRIDNGKGSISIANLSSSVVEIDLDTRTTTANALQTWFSIPPGRRHEFIGRYLQDIEGTVQAKLDISIPVNKSSAKQKVDVRLKFDKTRLRAPAWGVELSDINGIVRITGKGVSAKGLNALYFKDPIVVSISSTAQNRQTIVLAKGKITSRNVFNRLPEFIVQGVEGHSPWQIRLAIANQQDNQRQPVVLIRAASQLENTTVSLPEPFSKSPKVQRELSAELAIFGAGDMSFKVKYGPDIKLRGRLDKDQRGSYRLAAMDIGFSTPLKEPATRGLRIYGLLPSLPLDDWLVLGKSIVDSQSEGAPGMTELLEAIDLKVQTVSFFGQDNLNMDFNLTRTPQGFIGTVDTSLIRGKYKIPFLHSAADPIRVDLEFLKYRSLDTQSKSTGVLPQDLFDIRLRSEVFEYNDVVFSDLMIDAHLETDTLVIDAMELRHNNLVIKLSAHWQYIPRVNEHFTTASFSVKGKQFGQTIASLDIGDIMHNGEVDIEGRAGWSGELLRINWDSLIGEARFKVLDGVLKNVDPGKGRLVGLFNISLLPRRLLLDFSDVIGEGMQFEKLTGNFKIDQGNLYTADTYLDGPAAKIYISGRTGLVARDYDQTMIVVPQVRGTLPVLAAWLSGSAAGWAVLLLQKLLKKAIDKGVATKYRVTGTWDDPIIEKIKVVKETTKTN